MKLRYLLLIAVLSCAPWVVNVIKFVDCDFESDYRCEAIHGAGVFIPPASFITMWFDDDEAI